MATTTFTPAELALVGSGLSPEQLAVIGRIFSPAEIAAALPPSMAAAIAAELAKLQSPAPRLLYRSDFAGSSVLPSGSDYWDKGTWLNLTGPALDPSLGRVRLLALTDPLPYDKTRSFDVISNTIELRGGDLALRQTIKRSVNGTAPMGAAATQTALQFLPTADVTSCYIAAKVMLQSDLVAGMAASLQPDSWAWRDLFSTKTGTQLPSGFPGNDGDHRTQVSIRMLADKVPFWMLIGDNNAGTSEAPVTYFSQENHKVPVPRGVPFLAEWYWKRGENGRVAFNVGGKPVFDYRGPNMGALNLPINRIYAPVAYASSQFPIDQWVFSVEAWDSIPSTGTISV